MERIMIFDGSNTLMRAYFGVPMMRTSTGFPTNAIKGTVNILTSLIKKHAPTHVAFVLDHKHPTHRHIIYPEYKGGRVRDPEVAKNLLPQRKIIRQLLADLGVKVVCRKGVEADDIVGVITHSALEAGMEVIIVSNDKDFGQLLRKRVTMLRYMANEKAYASITRETCEDHFGVPWNHVKNMLMIMGDKVDNIPGVPGLGMAAIVKLIATAKNIEDADTSVLNKKQRETFEACRKQFKLTRELVTINTRVVKVNLSKMKLGKPNRKALAETCRELEARQIHQALKSYIEYLN